MDSQPFAEGTPEVPPSPPAPTPAGFRLRVFAKLCDLFVLFVIQLGLLFLLCVGDAFQLPFTVTLAVMTAGTVLPYLAYFARGHSGGRRTWGYKLAGLQLQSADGGAVPPGRSLLRAVCSGIAFSLICCVGLLMLLPGAVAPQKRTLYDFLARTRPIGVRRPHWLPLVLGSCGYLAIIGWMAAGLPFPARAFYVPAGSMENTLRINDRILVNKVTYVFQAPQFGDIVVFRAPPAALVASNTNEATDFVKRCVGTPGEVVSLKDGQLYRNGQAVKEPYVNWANDFHPALSLGEPGVSESDPENKLSYDMKIVNGTVYSRDYEYDQPGPWRKNGEVVDDTDQERISKAPDGAVPPDSYLMLGDHRSNSNDSHFWGFLPRRNIEGRVMGIYWPLSRLRDF